MVRDPRKNNDQYYKASPLLFFLVALVVVAFGALLEWLQGAAPLQIRGSSLLLAGLAALAIALIALRSRLT